MSDARIIEFLDFFVVSEPEKAGVYVQEKKS